MSSAENLATETYVQLTTFTRDGRAKPAPVWIAPLGNGKFGFTTGAKSWKVRRIRRDSRVELRPCNSRGQLTPGGWSLEARAHIASEEEKVSVRDAVRAKYGWQLVLIETIAALGRLFGTGAASDAAIVISLDTGS